MQSAAAPEVKLKLLTPKERECLRLVARHQSSKEIAATLGISKASVDTYCNRARAKLGVASRRDAAQLVAAFDLSDSLPEISPAVDEDRTAFAPAAQPPTVTVLPPLSSLGPAGRLGVILGGAVVLALAFGMLVSGLQALDEVVDAARTPPAQTRPS